MTGVRRRRGDRRSRLGLVRRDPPRHPQAGQLGPAVQVRPRRRLRLRRQPARLRGARPRPAGAPPPRRRGRRLLRRGHQQLPLEPPSGPSAPRDGHAGFQAARFFAVSLVGLGFNLAVLELLVSVAGARRAARAGDRRRARDAGELHRQQAVDVRRALSASASRLVALLAPAPRRCAAEPAPVAAGRRCPATPDGLRGRRAGGARDRRPRPGRRRADRPLRAARDRDPGQGRRRAGRSATSATTDRGRPGDRRRARPARCARRGPATRSRGRWRAATRASSATCSTRPTSGSRSARSSSPACSTGAGRGGSPTSTCSSLLAFGVSHVFFNRGEIGVSVPLVYPVLAYLLARMLWLGFRGGERAAADRAGAWLGDRRRRPDRLPADDQRRRLGRDRRRLRGRRSAPTGSPTASRSTARASSPTTTASATPTGPANYYAYVPFELALPWSGEWDELPAAHAAAIAFDLATVARPVRLRRCGCGRAAAGASSAPCSPSPGSPIRTRPSRCSRTPTTRCSRRCSSGRWSLFARPLGRGALLALAATGEVRAAGAGAAVRRRRARAARGARPRRRPAAAPRCARCSPSRPRSSAVAALMLAHPAIDPGPGDVLGADRRQPARARARRSRSGARSTGLGWLQPSSSALAAGARGRARLRSPPADDRPGRGARGGGADRGPARRRPLVLPLHPLVPAGAADRARDRDRFGCGRGEWVSAPLSPIEEE